MRELAALDEEPAAGEEVELVAADLRAQDHQQREGEPEEEDGEEQGALTGRGRAGHHAGILDEPGGRAPGTWLRSARDAASPAAYKATTPGMG